MWQIAVIILGIILLVIIVAVFQSLVYQVNDLQRKLAKSQEREKPTAKILPLNGEVGNNDGYAIYAPRLNLYWTGENWNSDVEKAYRYPVQAMATRAARAMNMWVE